MAKKLVDLNKVESGFYFITEEHEMCHCTYSEDADYDETLKIEHEKPMKIKEIHLDEYFCPACGSENNCNDGIVGDNYCPNCGQWLAR